MATITYTLGKDSFTSRQALTPGVCTSTNGSAGSGGTVAFSFEPETEQKTLVKGDHVHASPFEGLYRTVEPMNGKFTILRRQRTTGTTGSISACGESAGTTGEYVADIGYYIRPASSIPLPTPPAATMARLKALADTKANADLRRSLFNAPLIFAERKQTIDLLKRKGLQLASLVRGRQSVDVQRWLKTRKADKRRLARDIAGEHLAFLFGVLPLVSEIEGIAGALSSDQPLKITGRGRASENTVVNLNRDRLPTTTSIGAYDSPAYYATLQTTTRFSHRTSVSCTVTLSGAQYARDAGFNPLATFYDLVPLSFLSDFVSNLGTFIRSLDPLVGVDFLSGSSTSWVETKAITTVKGTSLQYVRPDAPLTLYRVVTNGDGKGSVRTLRVQRSVLTDYPDSSLMWVNNMSLSKAGTLASLAVQRYLKPLRRLFAVKAFRYRGPRPRYLPPIKYR